MKTLFYNGKFHTMVSEEDQKNYMIVEDGKIIELGNEIDISKFQNKVDLLGKHVYPCLIDGHTHMLLTIAVMAMGFNACEITKDGIEPHTIAGVEKRVREYVRDKGPKEIIAINNYIRTAIDERRMPTREELDSWGGGRPIVIYNIDGHSTSLSTAMLNLVGIPSENHSGVLEGEENERAQGRIIDTVGSVLGLKELARGIAKLHNTCAEYGINILGALEGNGDSIKDTTTKLIIKLARHFDIGVRLYLQYTDINRVMPYKKLMKHPRVGGCGDWEMDGASGSHSAAFSVPYQDNGKKSDCYYTQDFVDDIVKKFDEEGFQISSHAIGDLAIDRILKAYNKTTSGTFHRIEHCEFFDEAELKELKKGKYAIEMQPGYAWIDKRYLNTYSQVLPQNIRDRMKFKSLFDSGVIVCGSSDSPVQDLDPYLQMLGMVQFYNEEESITPYQALLSYTKNAAEAILERDDYGTLEPGKIADFFTSSEDFFSLNPNEVVDFRPDKTYYKGKAYVKKKGTVLELLKMMLSKPKQI